MDEYLFDLRGYLLLKGALAPDEVRNINGILDKFIASQFEIFPVRNLAVILTPSCSEKSSPPR